MNSVKVILLKFFCRYTTVCESYHMTHVRPKFQEHNIGANWTHIVTRFLFGNLNSETKDFLLMCVLQQNNIPRLVMFVRSFYFFVCDK